MWRSKKHNFAPSSEKCGSRVFVQKHNFKEKKVLLTCRHASTTSSATGVNREPLFERNEALPYVCLPPLERPRLACSCCMRSQPMVWHTHTCSRSFLHWTSLCTVMDVPDTQRIFRPARREGERRAVWWTCGSLSSSVLESRCVI